MAQLRLTVIQFRVDDDGPVTRTTGAQAVVNAAVMAYVRISKSLGGVGMQSNQPATALLPYLLNIKRWAKGELAPPQLEAFLTLLTAALQSWVKQPKKGPKRPGRIELTDEGVRFSSANAADRSMLLTFTPEEGATQAFWTVSWNFLNAPSTEAATAMVAEVAPLVSIGDANDRIQTVQAAGVSVRVVQNWEMLEDPLRPARRQRVPGNRRRSRSSGATGEGTQDAQPAG